MSSNLPQATPPPYPNTGVCRLLWSITGLNTNITTDQALTKAFPFTLFRITEIMLTNASASLALLTKTLDIRDATGGGGNAIVSNQVLTTATTSASNVGCSLSTTNNLSVSALYARLSASGTGVAATADLYILGYKLA